MILCIFLVHVAWNILYNCNPEGCPKLISHPFGLEMAAKSRKITEEQQNYLGRAKLFGKSTGKGGCGLKKPPEILKLPLLRQSRQKTATSQSPVTKKKWDIQGVQLSPLHPWWQSRGKAQRLHGPKSGCELDILKRGITRGRKVWESGKGMSDVQCVG